MRAAILPVKAIVLVTVKSQPFIKEKTMDFDVVTISARIVEEFCVVYQGVSSTDSPLPKPERTLRRILKLAHPCVDVDDLAENHEHLLFFRKDRYVFGISRGEHALESVLDITNLRRRFQGQTTRDVAEIASQNARENAILGWKWDTPFASCPPLSMKKLAFTFHALRRFRKYFPAHANGNAESGARKVFTQTTESEAISQKGMVIRLVNNHLKQVRYFRRGKCRFVVLEKIDGTFLVLTVEIDRFKGR